MNGEDEESKKSSEGSDGGSSSSSDGSGSDSDSDDGIGPRPPTPPGGGGGGDGDGDGENPPAKKRKKMTKLAFEKELLDELPSCDRYEKSFMHRDVVTRAVVSRGGFVITASGDGHVKFWNKDEVGFEFVKHFRAHLGFVQDVAVNSSGTLFISVATDKCAKVFDVQNFDMINILRFKELEKTKENFEATPSCCEWVHRGDDVVAAVAVSFVKSQAVYIFDAKGDSAAIKVLDRYHVKPVVTMKYNVPFDVCVSADEAGMIEYWHGAQGGYDIPGKRTVMFKSKLDTDLFEFAKNKTFPISIAVSGDGKMLATFGNDRKVRLFRFLSGKLYCVIDESLGYYIKLQSEKKMFQSMDFNRKIANEKELEKVVPESGRSPFSHSNVVFDQSGNFILYPTVSGVKIVNIIDNKSRGVIGKGENLRFLNIALSQGAEELIKPTSGASSMPSSIEEHVSENPSLKRVKPEPILFCTAYKKNRFYLFTRTSPKDSAGDRDVFNEKPSQEERIAAVSESEEQPKVYESATIHTSVGDIFLKLFPKECPKTVENFCTLAKGNYFNGNIWHRVIKQFMIQTGDPTGIGTGGESSFGHEFEDEFHPKLRHDRPYTLSMANAGPNTNGSQFFITVCPTPWLDNKHTVFGRVVRGMDVALNISNVKTHPKTDKPYDDVTVMSVSVKDPMRL